jgi:hypothetical protein
MTKQLLNDDKKELKTPICNGCGVELGKFGGILLSDFNKKGQVKKYHLCKDCFEFIEKTVMLHGKPYVR